MLVNDNFIFISLPRSASTSFVISCLKNKITLKHYNDDLDINQSQIDLTMNNEDIADKMLHNHEGILLLNQKFGYDYEFIAINRDRYERWISIWQHCIDEVFRMGDINSYNIMKNLSENEVFDFDHNIMANKSFVERDIFIESFIKRFNLTKNNPYLKIIFGIAFTPFSHYHNFNEKIIWFDFKKLNLLEEWVSERLKLDFKMEKINSSKHFECKIKLTDNFKIKYDNVFDRYDTPKQKLTLL